MSIIERFEIVREKESLNKAQFERMLNKSTGYLNMLIRRNSTPGVDVIIKFCEALPNYSLDWLMTGEGSMMKNEEKQIMTTIKERQTPYAGMEGNTILTVRDDLKKDLGEMSEGMTTNFENISRAMLKMLQGQQKIIRFIDKIDAEKISAASEKLEDFLKASEEEEK